MMMKMNICHLRRTETLRLVECSHRTAGREGLNCRIKHVKLINNLNYGRLYTRAQALVWKPGVSMMLFGEETGEIENGFLNIGRR